MDDFSKSCRRCEALKPASEFKRDRTRPDGRFPYCKACTSTADKQYYAQNAERVRQRVGAAYQDNRARIIEQRRSHWAQNREEYRARFKARYWANPEKYRSRSGAEAAANRARINARGAQWRAANPDKLLAIRRRRRAAIHAADGRITSEEWRALCTFYGHFCLCCGGRRRLTLDHIVPLILGGSHTIDNAQPLCRSCNSRKGRRAVDYRAGRILVLSS